MTSNKVTEHLANERTLLAWVRTSIALLGFGVLVAKFGVGNADSRLLSIHNGTNRTELLGMAFCVTGIASLLFALINYTMTRRMIETAKFKPSTLLIGLYVFVVAVLATAVTGYIMEGR